jgi:DNA-binding response OmpR family regulator
MRVLIVEDEKNLREDAQRYLQKNGYECEFSGTVSGGKQKLNDLEFNTALIDIGLPDGSGIELVKYIKLRFPDMGIIIISARNSLDDKVEALKIGADDYLTKPYHLSELNARLYSVNRRRNFGGKNTLNFKGLEINVADKVVTVNGSILKLTKKEYEVLIYLASNPTSLVTKEAIADSIWGEKAEMAETFDFVYTQLKNLKKKLVDAGLKDYIKVVYGMGYRFMDQ